MTDIAVRQVSKRFGSVRAVEGLSFNAPAGKVTGFLGPNGAGKTTTLRMLLGLVRPTAGEALIGGIRYDRLRDPTRVVGAVLEYSASNPGRTGRDQLRVLAAVTGAPTKRVDEVIALQAYLCDCETDLHSLVAWARENKRPLNIRLVKGAYWDYETVVAQQREWPIPVWQKKAESDANYEKLTVFLLENADLITPNFASHNVRSVAHAIVQAMRDGFTVTCVQGMHANKLVMSKEL